MKRTLFIIAISVFLCSCAQQAAPLNTSQSYDQNGFQNRYPDQTLFSHQNEPQGPIQLQQSRANIQGNGTPGGVNSGGLSLYGSPTYVGGSPVFANGIPGGISAFSGGGAGLQGNPITDFIGLANDVLSAYPQVQSIGWIYFADQPFTTARAQGTPYFINLNSNACTHFSIAVTSPSQEPLARIRISGNAPTQPSYTRSGPNNNTLNVEFELAGSGTGDFIFAIVDPNFQGGAFPGGPTYSPALGQSLTLTITTSACNLPQYTMPDTATGGSWQLNPVTLNDPSPYQIPFFTEQFGVNSVSARFISRFSGFGSPLFYSPFNWTAPQH